MPSDQSFTIVKLTVVTGFLVETIVTMVKLQGRKQTQCCVLVKLHRTACAHACMCDSAGQRCHVEEVIWEMQGD